MRAFEVAAKELWAIESSVNAAGQIQAPALETILDIAQRAHEPNFEAVAQKLADRADAGGIREMRGNVAVVNITGPIFRYANLFTAVSGATSVEMLATAFRAAVEDPAASAVVLNIDSPGGQVAGISELATAIYQARAQKPIIAYADDLTASGAYWLASAASRIVAADTAQLGSIGVVATVDVRDQRPGVKSYQFVSSVSPNKRPDLETDDGRAAIQQRIDDLAAVFVSTVARNRAVSEDKVLTGFGRGGLLIAAKAVAAGMADSIGTFEELLASLNDRSSATFSFGGNSAEASSGGLSMEQKPTAGSPPVETPQPPAVDVEAVRRSAAVEAKAAERLRIGAILACEDAQGREDLARTIALETDTDALAAKKLLAAAPKKAEPAANPLAAAMATVANPKVGTDAETSADSVAKAVRSTVALYQGKEVR
jgi:capsid assembly protease